MAPGPPGSVTQGRRFNGRPAVSKTASGGSNPSAPANRPAQSLGAWVWDIVFGQQENMAEEKKNFIDSTRDYYNSLRVEMRKVTWPNRKQVESTTAVVIISVFAFAGYFEVVDTILSRGVKGILNYFTK
jgi:preprotein translocase subunit SecE